MIFGIWIMPFYGIISKALQPAFEPSSDLPLFLAQAREEITRNDREGIRYSVSLPASVEALRWFALPQEVASTAADTARIAS